MARSKEDSQDIAMYHMEKIMRQNKTVNTPKTSLESFQEEEAWKKMTPEEKMKQKSPYDWERDLRDELLLTRKHGVGQKQYSWVMTKYKHKMNEFREKGVSLSEVISFIKEKQLEYMNLF